MHSIWTMSLKIPAKTILCCFLLALPLVAAQDAFSEGTANYVILDWEEPTPETLIKGRSIILDGDFLFEVFTRNDEEKVHCKYNVLKISLSKNTIHEPSEEFALLKYAKVSCSIDIYSLSKVIRLEADNCLKYRLEDNKCRTVVYSYDAENKKIHEMPVGDHDCKDGPAEPSNAVVELDHEWKESFRHRDSVRVTWNNQFSFTVSEIQQEEKCVYRGLEVAYVCHKGAKRSDVTYTAAKQAKLTCEVDIHTLAYVVRQVSPDTLVYKTGDRKCYKATYSLEPDTENPVETGGEYDCNELPCSLEDVPTIAQLKEIEANPHMQSASETDSHKTTIQLTDETTSTTKMTEEDGSFDEIYN